MLKRWAWPIAGLVGVVLALLLAPIASPDAQVDLQVTRADSIRISREFLERQGFDLSGYDHAVQFASRSSEVFYLQRTLPLSESNRQSQEFRVWHWSVRWYRPGVETEYLVWIDPSQPDVMGYARKLPEAGEGARLERQKARAVAEQFLAAQGYALTEWVLEEESSTDQPNRVDHQFTWRQPGVQIGEAYPRLEVSVQGDQLVGPSRYF